MRPILFPCLSVLVFTAACGGAASATSAQAPRAASPMTDSAAEGATAAMFAPSMAQPMSPPPPSAPGSHGGAPAPSPAPSAAPSKATMGAGSSRNAKSVEAPVEASHAPLIIYAGELQMMTDEDRIASTIDKAIDVAESFGGYLAARKDASVEVRVPSAHFREALTKMETLGAVVHRSVSANDVSEEVHDAEVRLLNLRATRARLQEFLAKAPNINDTLVVERELERVAQEIDQLEGRLQFLKARAAFSQITLGLQAKPKVVPVVVTPPPAPPRRFVALPVDWLDKLGVDRLLTIR